MLAATRAPPPRRRLNDLDQRAENDHAQREDRDRSEDSRVPPDEYDRIAIHIAAGHEKYYVPDRKQREIDGDSDQDHRHYKQQAQDGGIAPGVFLDCEKIHRLTPAAA